MSFWEKLKRWRSPHYFVFYKFETFRGAIGYTEIDFTAPVWICVRCNKTLRLTAVEMSHLPREMKYGCAGK